MKDMAAVVLCFISFIVLGLGNGVISDSASPSAENDAVDANLIVENVSPAISSTTVHSLAATVSDGARGTTLPVTDIPLPMLDDSSPPSASPNPPVVAPTSTENAKTSAIQDTTQVELFSKKESSAETQSEIPVANELIKETSIANAAESTDVKETPNASGTTPATGANDDPVTAPVLKERAQEAAIDGEHVSFVKVSNLSVTKPQVLIELAANGSFKTETSPENSAQKLDEGKTHDPDSQTSTTVSTTTESYILSKESETLPPPPTAASLADDGKLIQPSTGAYDAESDLPDSYTSSSVEVEGAATVLHILTKENEKPPPPNAASLTDDGKLIQPSTGAYDAESDLPDSYTSSSVEVEGAATVLHILTKENEKPPPPTAASLTDDGKSSKSDTDSEPAPVTQVAQVQSIPSGEVLLTPAPNTTNTTIKPSTRLTAEKCPTNSTIPCVSKCCPYGYSLVREKCRKSQVRFVPQFTLLVNGFNDTKPENETEKMAKYNLIAQNLCVKNRYSLDPLNDSLDEFHLLFNGSLWLPATKPHHTMVASDQYCMEVFKIGDQEIMLPLICFNNQPIVESSFHFMVYPIGLLISVPFLLATFIVYNMIPELRNLHGKSLSCYVLCLMLAYIFLAVVQLGGQGFDNHVCVGVAFAIQFSFIACFFWLNVLCFDTWRNVFLHGDLGYTMEKSQERSFFIFYSIYAWSFTIALIIVTMVMNFTPTIPSSYLKPGIGENTCWFNTEREAFPYFYGPVGVLIIINVILFIMTAIKLILEHHKQAICVRTPGQTFRLCLTLFFIMGINWVMEIISWAAGGPAFIWYITDICNTLQGIFIFVVFVMDERVRGLCKTELFPRLQEFFAACCPQRRTRRASTEPRYDSINGQEMVYMFKKDDIEQ